MWNGMNDALVAGDKARAMRSLSSEARAIYGPVFDRLMPGFAAIAASYSSPAATNINGTLSEYAVSRMLNGTRRLFLIYFARDTDGVWRLSSM